MIRGAVLFDIDGTLIRPRGAGRRAFQRALRDWTGREIDDTDYDFSGRTDQEILRALCLRSDHPYPDPRGLESFVDAYVARLEESLAEGPFGDVCPGVFELLAKLDEEPRLAVGLVTGNFARGAERKLAHYGLSGRFAFGGFGDDAEERTRLVPIALERLLARSGIRIDPAGAVVIGDTARDLEAGRAAGAPVILVETGISGSEGLRDLGAEAVFEDLRNTSEVMATIEELILRPSPALHPGT